jgi:hypothetical protein
MSDLLMLLRARNVQELAVSLFGYFLPLLLACGWAGLAALALAERAAAGRRTTGWALLVLLLPWIGAAAYLLSPRAPVSRAIRLTAVWGGMAVVAATYAYHFAAFHLATGH